MDKMNEIKMAVSNNLKKYRLAKNLTQKQLADEINKKLGTDLKHNTISGLIINFSPSKSHYNGV